MKWEKHFLFVPSESLPFTCSLHPTPLSLSCFPYCCPPPSLFLFQFSSSKIRFLDKIRFFVDPLLFFSCRFSFQNSILSQHNHHFTSITVVMTHRPFLSISASTSSASPLEASSQISTADKDGQFKAKCSKGLSPLIAHPDTYYFTQLCYRVFDAQRL